MSAPVLANNERYGSRERAMPGTSRPIPESPACDVHEEHVANPVTPTWGKYTSNEVWRTFAAADALTRRSGVMSCKEHGGDGGIKRSIQSDSREHCY